MPYFIAVNVFIFAYRSEKVPILIKVLIKLQAYDRTC